MACAPFALPEHSAASRLRERPCPHYGRPDKFTHASPDDSVTFQRGALMGESELIGVIRDVNAQYAVLFGQVITINFAMIVAIYYFLHRSPLLFRIAAFGFYAVGMLALVGLLLQQGNYKFEA